MGFHEIDKCKHLYTTHPKHFSTHPHSNDNTIMCIYVYIFGKKQSMRRITSQNKMVLQLIVPPRSTNRWHTDDTVNAVQVLLQAYKSSEYLHLNMAHTWHIPSSNSWESSFFWDLLMGYKPAPTKRMSQTLKSNPESNPYLWIRLWVKYQTLNVMGDNEIESSFL